MSEFEYILLKKLIYSGEYFGKAMPILKNKYFSKAGNKELFNLIKNHYNKYSSTPSLTELVASVKDVANSTVREEIVDSLQEISKTDEVQNMDFMLDETVSWVKDSIFQEGLVIGSDGLMQKDDELKLKSKLLMDEMSKINIDSDLGLDFDSIDEMIEYYSERNLGIKTDHKELNKRLGPGFIDGTLSLILAPPGIGKSLMMTDLISGMIKKNKNILLVSLEMGDKEIMKRVHANAMDLPINSLIDLSKTPEELEKMKMEDPQHEFVSKEMIVSAYNEMKLSGTVGKLFIKDYPAGSFSPLMLEQLVQSYKLEKEIEFDIVFIDYVGIMKSDLVSPSAGLYSYIKSIAEETRASAKRLNLPIISASQLNRSAISGGPEEADNSNVSDSMGSVMTADFMLFLLQNDEMKERKEIVLKCTKNRFNGRTDTWMMNIDYTKMRFSDMLIQNGTNDGNINGNIDITKPPSLTNELDDDFGIVTSDKLQKAEDYAESEVKSIVREDYEKLQEAEKSIKDPFKPDIDDIFTELGL